MEKDEELILADEVASDDEASPCYVNDPPYRDICAELGTILIGKEGELAYCPDHAAELVLQLLALKPVQEALLKREKAVLILDDSNGAENELQRLETLLDLAAPTAEVNREPRDRLRSWANEKFHEMNRLVPVRVPQKEGHV